MFTAGVSASRADAAWLEDPAPEFALSDLAGQERTLASMRGKVVFVHFWASWCTSCKEEFPKLNELAGAYDPKDFQLLAITVDKAQSNAEKFLKKHLGGEPRLQVLRDPDGKTARAYRNRAIPITYVVDPKGVIRFVHLGYHEGDEARWRSEIAQLRASK